MLSIWKFVFKVDDVSAVSMPVGARALSADLKDGEPCLWALVNPNAPVEIRKIRMFGTGHPISDDVPSTFDFVDTFQVSEGGTVLVFHVWIERKAAV